jgi:anti-sigma regulatory factor (Ser/Thr protein kinase)
MDAPLLVALPRDPQAAQEARRQIEQDMAGRLSAAALDDVKIVATELVNNAVIHGTGEVALSVATDDAVARIVVRSDGVTATPALHSRTPGIGGGWGLRIVDRLAIAWGAIEPGTVWADLPLEPEHFPRASARAHRNGRPVARTGR